MIKNTTKLNKEVQTELLNYPLITYFVLIITIPFVIALCVGLVVLNREFLALLLITIILWIFSILMYCLLKKQIKTFDKYERTNIYEFNEKEMIISTYLQQEQIAQAKIKYKNLTKIKETANYLFLYLGSVCYAVDKRNSPENIENIKELVKKGMKIEKN